MSGSGVPERPGTYGPLVIDWLVGEEHPTADAVALTILDLARQESLALSWQEGQLCISRLRAGSEEHEAAVMDLLFHRAARDKEALSAAQLTEWLALRPEEARRWWLRWSEGLSHHAIAALRGAAKGSILRRRQTRRDRDTMLEAWQEWLADTEQHGRITHPHPDTLAEWAQATMLATALGRGPALLERLQRGLSDSEQRDLAGRWCPVREGETLAQALQCALDALPCLGPFDAP